VYAAAADLPSLARFTGVYMDHCLPMREQLQGGGEAEGRDAAAIAAIQDVCAALVDAALQLQQPQLVQLALRALVPLRCTRVGGGKLRDAIARASEDVRILAPMQCRVTLRSLAVAMMSI
jgi:hypothetical protein